MKILIFTFFLAFTCSIGFGQKLSYVSKDIDSLKHELAIAKHDTSRAYILNLLCWSYRFINPDSAVIYGQKALTLSRQTKYPVGEADALIILGFTHQFNLNNPVAALEYSLKGLKVAEKNKIDSRKAWALERVGIAYRDLKNYPQAFRYLNLAQNLFGNIGDSMMVVTIQYQLAQTYFRMSKIDSAYHYAQLVFDKADKLKIPWLSNNRYEILAEAYEKKGKLRDALNLLRIVIRHNSKGALLNYNIANLYLQLHKTDSSIYYAQKSLEIAQKGRSYSEIINSATLLSGIYEKSNPQKTIEYNKIIISFQDSLINSNKANGMKNLLSFDEQERQYEIETAQTEYQNKVKLYALLVGLAIFSLIAFILYRNNRQKHKANVILENTLSKLKATQNQLIQSEKLASLGELTAGIAHEIQNPLNFVNNFAEMSVGLAQEINEEIDKNQIDKEYVKELMGDLTSNQEKINLHGKRASSIVTGMLEHSRASTGERVLTDINKLADESLRLSYHGLRAKDKDGSTLRFNSDFELIADPNLPKINVIPQDIGRVLINLINNAFYAVASDASATLSDRSHRKNVSPKVTVNTRWLSVAEAPAMVEIRVTDNGSGIPENVKQKIFQPFFTTKPTGQGTGLGLSLAYDIITKGHGGTIEVESIEGEGTTFIVKLPI